MFLLRSSLRKNQFKGPPGIGRGKPRPVSDSPDDIRRYLSAAVVSVKQGDAVDLYIKVGSGTELGFLKNTVDNDLGILFVVGIGVDVSHIAGKGLAANGEFSGIEDLEGTVLELGGGSVDGSLCAGGGSLVVTAVRRTDSVESDPVQSVSIFLPSRTAFMAYWK